VVKHGRERFAETCEASASQPIEPFSRFGDDSLERCLDKPDRIRKWQLHFQSMPVREPKLAEAHMPVSRSPTATPSARSPGAKNPIQMLCDFRR